MYAEVVEVETSVVPLETMIAILVHPNDLKLQYRHDSSETAKMSGDPVLGFDNTRMKSPRQIGRSLSGPIGVWIDAGMPG